MPIARLTFFAASVGNTEADALRNMAASLRDSRPGAVALIIASLVGTLIPMFFNKIHVDPAVASGPLITTTNDLIAAITYYGLAWVLLINTLHVGS